MLASKIACRSYGCDAGLAPYAQTKLANVMFSNELASLLFVPPAQAAETSIYLATVPDVATVSGKYFKKCAEATENPASLNREACERLWNISAELVGLEA